VYSRELKENIRTTSTKIQDLFWESFTDKEKVVTLAFSAVVGSQAGLCYDNHLEP